MPASSTNPDLTVDEFLEGVRSPNSFYELSGLLHAGEPLVRPKPTVGIEEQDSVEAYKVRSILLAIANVARWNPKEHETAKVAIECLLRAFHQNSPAYFSHSLPPEVWKAVFEALENNWNLNKPYTEYLSEFARRVAALASDVPPGVAWERLSTTVLRDVLFQSAVDQFLVKTRHFQYLVACSRLHATPFLCGELWGTSHYFADAHLKAFQDPNRSEIAQVLCALLFLKGDLIEKPPILPE